MQPFTIEHINLYEDNFIALAIAILSDHSVSKSISLAGLSSKDEYFDEKAAEGHDN
jgi:hypothetical protein